MPRMTKSSQDALAAKRKKAKEKREAEGKTQWTLMGGWSKPGRGSEVARKKSSMAKGIASTARSNRAAAQVKKDDARVASGLSGTKGKQKIGVDSGYYAAKERISARKPAAKKAPAKKAPAKKTSFKQAFADARKKKGAGGVFTWKKSEGGDGKKYTTERADDKKKASSPKRTKSRNPVLSRMKKRQRRVRGGK